MTRVKRRDVGQPKAALVLDYILAELGPTIYNVAIADAKAFFDERKRSG